MGDNKKTSFSILMFPWLAHGHITPFLELAKKLAERNFVIYFCSTPINLNFIKPKLSPKHLRSICLVELQLSSEFLDFPPHYHTTNGLPPHLMSTLKKALDMAAPYFLTLLKNLTPNLLLYDFIQPWAATLASSLNIPAVHFTTSSAATTCFFFHLVKKPYDTEWPPPITNLQDCLKFKALEKFVRDIYITSTSNHNNDMSDMNRFTQSFEQSSFGLIFVKTFRELEGKYLDYLSLLLDKRIVPTGPLVHDDDDDDDISIKDDEYDEDGTKIIEWLNNKERSSTVFMCFGSEYFLSKEEREEIAHGLELSQVNFIWVIRFPLGEKIELEKELPKGFLQRTKDKGIIVEGWAPQRKILRHESIGGFVSHCGWSSVMEGLKYRVPIIAMPMHLDQPINAKVVEEVGVGLEVKRNKLNDGLDRDEIAKVIKQVVLEKMSENVRKKVKDMSDLINKINEELIDRVVDELKSVLTI